MRRLIYVLVFALWPAALSAQLLHPNDSGVAMGHLHYKVRDVQANQKFWIALGAAPIKIDTREVLKFRSVLIFLDKAESSGGTEGSVVNHVGFRVPNTRESLARMKAAGYKTDLNNTGSGVLRAGGRTLLTSSKPCTESPSCLR